MSEDDSYIETILLFKFLCSYFNYNVDIIILIWNDSYSNKDCSFEYSKNFIMENTNDDGIVYCET